MRQETPHPLPVLDYGRPPRGARWRRIMERVMMGVLAVTIFLSQPRLLSIVLLVLFIAPCALAMFRRRRYLIVAALVVGVSSFLPFDVAPVSFHSGERIGTSPGGPHFVRFTGGDPRHAYMIKTYGEYIRGAAAFPPVVPLRWIWVWD